MMEVKKKGLISEEDVSLILRRYKLEFLLFLLILSDCLTEV